MLSIHTILFALLGITTGISAGLFGIGGGMLIVPGLFFLFSFMELPPDSLMHLAAGTSTCIMICTSISSTWAHQLKGHIQWGIFRRIVFGIGIGVIIGHLLSDRLDTNSLETIFGVFLLVVSFKILLDMKSQPDEHCTPNTATIIAVGILIGFKSGVLGVGGGALSVPFLLYCGLPMNKASGTSASFTLAIAILGTIAFLMEGSHEEVISLSAGYIYWPAVLLVAPFTIIGAPIGAKLSSQIPAMVLRRSFGLLLLFLSLKMLVDTDLLTLMLPRSMAL